MEDIYGPGKTVYKCGHCGHLEYFGGICPSCHKGILKRYPQKVDIEPRTKRIYCSPSRKTMYYGPPRMKMYCGPSRSKNIMCP